MWIHKFTDENLWKLQMKLASDIGDLNEIHWLLCCINTKPFIHSLLTSSRIIGNPKRLDSLSTREAKSALSKLHSCRENFKDCVTLGCETCDDGINANMLDDNTCRMLSSAASWLHDIDYVTYANCEWDDILKSIQTGAWIKCSCLHLYMCIWYVHMVA